MKKLKTFRIYCDRPGGGWLKVVKGYSLESATRRLNKIHKAEPANGGDEVPDNFEEIQKKIHALENEMDEQIEILKKKHEKEIVDLRRKFEDERSRLYS